MCASAPSQTNSKSGLLNEMKPNAFSRGCWVSLPLNLRQHVSAARFLPGMHCGSIGHCVGSAKQVARMKKQLKRQLCILAVSVAVACAAIGARVVAADKPAAKPLTMTDVLAASKPSDWHALDPEN